MRVLLVNDWNDPEGGAESYLRWIRAGLTAAGDEVRLLVSGAGSRAGGTADYVAFGTDRLLPQAALQISNPFAARRLREALREFRPDVVHVSMFELHLSPAVLAPARDVPTVLNVGYYKPVCPTGLKLLPDGSLCSAPAGSVCRRSGCVGLAHWLRDRPRYHLIRRRVAGVDRVLACSEWLVAELARNGLRAESFPWPVPPPGDDFRREPATDPLFAYVGRLSREKGVSLLLRAFARVLPAFPRAGLRIVGDGPERGSLERLAGILGLGEAVRFLGAVPEDAVEARLADAWALVAPSLWAEPLGLVALEALARGVPVVASVKGGFAETVEPGVSGLLFPNGDEAALAGCLEEVASRRAFPRLSVPAETVEAVRERHSLATHVARLREVLAEVAGRPSAGAFRQRLAGVARGGR